MGRSLREGNTAHAKEGQLNEPLSKYGVTLLGKDYKGCGLD